MRVTSELALSQIKLNKKRTIGTVFAISLSTALVTAEICFATSGNHMLTDTLGPGYGDYAGTFSMIIAILATILGLLIAFMSITVISNIFSASANKRVQEFGILKCVGGTKKQIKQIVVYESLWLSVIGIPLGLILGTFIGYTGVKIADQYVADINNLARSVIMRPFSFSLSFHVSVWTYVFATFFSFIIVIWSANKPAKKVGKITAIKCIKGLGDNKNLKDIEVKNKIVECFFGYEGAIALRNIKRNKSAYKSTIRALALGIMLLLLTGGLAGQAQEFKDCMTPDSKEMNVNYCSIRDVEIDDETGRKKELIVAPISADIYNEITERLSQYGGNGLYGIGSDSCKYNAILNKEDITAEMKKAPNLYDENNETELSIVSVDEKLYKKLCDRAGADYGSNLLINSYKYNDNGIEKYVKPFKENVTEISVIDSDAKKSKIDIGGILHEEDLTEKGFSVRISRVDTMTKILNIAIVLGEIVMYGFVILLLIMGIASVISTLITNIRIRKREFAILKSVGMTSKSLRKMIYCESIICIIKASITGIAFGILIPFLINLGIREMFPVMYFIPWKEIILTILALFLFMMLITYLELCTMKNQSLIEEIRMDTM